MSLQARITALAQAIAADVKTMSAALSGKASASHGHAIADVTGLQDALDSLSGGGGSGGVPEAPTDGGTYARRNGAWVSALATDSDPAADLLGYFLGAPDGAVLEGMLGSLFWRIGWFDLLSSPASLASIFADSAAMVAICTSPRAYRMLMSSTDAANAFVSSSALTAVSIPAMTSNTAPSGVAMASSIYSSVYDAFKAFDSPASPTGGGYWCSALTGVANQWVGYDFGAPVFIHSAVLTPGSDSPVKDFRLQHSDDNAAWTTLATSVLSTTIPTTTYRPPESGGKHRYWRLLALSSHLSGANYVALREMTLKGFTW